MKNLKLANIVASVLSILLLAACGNTVEDIDTSFSTGDISSSTSILEETSKTTDVTSSTTDAEESSTTTQEETTTEVTTSQTQVITTSETTAATTSASTSTRVTTTVAPTTTVTPTTTTIPTTTQAVNLQVSLTIDLTALTDNPDLLGEPMQSLLVPESGYITANTAIDIEDGDNAIEILQMYLDANQIPYDIRSGAYVAAINNIYEFMAGGESGWVYSVNGTYPNIGAADYVLQDGDVIVWEYSIEKGF